MKSQIPILIVLYNPNEMSLNQLYTIQSNFILCVFDNSNTKMPMPIQTSTSMNASSMSAMVYIIIYYT